MIGLADRDDEVVGSGHAPLPRVDLLPPEIAELRRFRRVQTGLGGGVLAAVLVVALLYLGAMGAVGTSQEQVDQASAQQQGLQAQTTQYRDVTATYARAADAQALLVAAMGEEVRYSRLLNDLSLSLPEGVWLKSAAFTQAVPDAATTAAGTAPGIGTLTVTGVAFQYDDVALWLESLASQAGYVDPLLQTSTAVLLGPKVVVDWSTTVTLSPDALSGRYVTAGS